MDFEPQLILWGANLWPNLGPDLGPGLGPTDLLLAQKLLFYLASLVLGSSRSFPVCDGSFMGSSELLPLLCIGLIIFAFFCARHIAPSLALAFVLCCFLFFVSNAASSVRAVHKSKNCQESPNRNQP